MMKYEKLPDQLSGKTESFSVITRAELSAILSIFLVYSKFTKNILPVLLNVATSEQLFTWIRTSIHLLMAFLRIILKF